MNYKCFHVRPDFIDLTVDVVTPKRFINSLRRSFEFFISRAVSSDIFARGCAAPLKDGGLLSGFTPTTFRPFFIISCVFSSIVPALRCEGLTQDGLSQECITTKPSGIFPLKISYETLWARTLGANPPALIMPYPLLFLLASHSQQSSLDPKRTLLKNLFCNVSDLFSMQGLWVSKAPKSTEMLGGY